MEEFVEIPVDFFNNEIIKEDAYLYYDPNNGAIKTISFVPVDDVENLPHIRCPHGDAITMMQSDENANDWFVEDFGNNVHKLINVHKMPNIIQRYIIDPKKTTEMIKLSEMDSRSVGVTLRFKIDVDANKISVDLKTKTSKFNIKTKDDIDIQLMITAKNAPEYIKSAIEFKLSDVIRAGVLVIDIPITMTNALDFYTFRYTELNYVIEYAQLARNIIPLPKHFDDMKLVSRVGKIIPECLLFVRHDNELEIKIHKNGGSQYLRQTDQITIGYVKDGDPLKLIDFVCIPINNIENESIKIELPPNIGEFEICSSMLYNNVYYVDARYN